MIVVDGPAGDKRNEGSSSGGADDDIEAVPNLKRTQLMALACA